MVNLIEFDLIPISEFEQTLQLLVENKILSKVSTIFDKKYETFFQHRLNR